MLFADEAPLRGFFIVSDLKSKTATETDIPVANIVYVRSIRCISAEPWRYGECRRCRRPCGW